MTLLWQVNYDKFMKLEKKRTIKTFYEYENILKEADELPADIEHYKNVTRQE